MSSIWHMSHTKSNISKWPTVVMLIPSRYGIIIIISCEIKPPKSSLSAKMHFSTPYLTYQFKSPRKYATNCNLMLKFITLPSQYRWYSRLPAFMIKIKIVHATIFFISAIMVLTTLLPSTIADYIPTLQSFQSFSSINNPHHRWICCQVFLIGHWTRPRLWWF